MASKLKKHKETETTLLAIDQAICRDIDNHPEVVILDENGYVSTKKYLVIFVDEYNNWYLVGFFDTLEEATPEVNTYLQDYELDDEEVAPGTVPQFGKDAALGELTEYPSTFSMCFDRIIDTTCGCVAIRGFIF